MDMMFNIVPIFIGIVAFIIIVQVLREGVSYANSKAQPIVPVDAKVIEKRTYVSGGEHTHTTYYATFELENGSRMEFKIPRDEVGLLIEGDQGVLEFQGDLYCSFKRS